VRGKGKDTVVFKRDGGKAVFVKADISTATMLKVTVPAKLATYLVVRNGTPVQTRFRIRVLGKKLGKAFTTLKRSPLVSPVAPPATAPAPSAGDQDCDNDGVPNRLDTDDDNDLLVDTLEARIGTLTCNPDTDGDGISDGYEYQSARDLNDDDYQDPNRYLPYPGKKPYPNPLYNGDKDTDFDGDGLSLKTEYKLWQYTLTAEGAPADLSRLTYSDGRQYSVGAFGADGRWRGTLAAAGYDKQQSFLAWAAQAPSFDSGNGGYGSVYEGHLMHGLHGALAMTPAYYPLLDANLDGTVSPAEARYYDLDGNTLLSDDERDEDADGLTNYDETVGRMTSAYWGSCYQQEKAYPVVYADTDVTDADSDGDGVRDGADDQDHDDIPNVIELSRFAASGMGLDDTNGGQCTPDPNLPQPPSTNHPSAYGRVNPFNPCLPDAVSRTCLRHPAFSSAPAPFDGSLDWASLQ
jgi:hypothetical protein